MSNSDGVAEAHTDVYEDPEAALRSRYELREVDGKLGLHEKLGPITDLVHALALMDRQNDGDRRVVREIRQSDSPPIPAILIDSLGGYGKGEVVRCQSIPLATELFELMERERLIDPTSIVGGMDMNTLRLNNLGRQRLRLKLENLPESPAQN